MADYPQISAADLIARLEPPRRRIAAVLDTDTYNEIDDQFALAYSLLSPDHIDLQAVYAAPFLNKRSDSAGDGMEKSYEEILRVFQRLKRDPHELVHKGSDQFMVESGRPVESTAATDLIERALTERDGPLYVMTIGAPTNVASAILMEPKIVERIVIVWLGGHPHYWPDNREFNCMQDVPSSQVLFDCGVPFVQIPCALVAEILRSTVAEIDAHLKGKSEIGDYLCGIFAEYSNDHFAWSKVIWDIAAPAYLIEPSWLGTEVVVSPILNDSLTYSTDRSRHPIRVVTHINRDAIFRDMFQKLIAAD